jgi:hypothetical protein
MSQLLVAFGIIFVLLGAGAALRPHALLRLARRVTVRTWLRLVAFAVRVVVGSILILVASSTVFPLALRVIGVLLIVSGVTVLVIGNAGVQRIVSWALGLGPVAVVVGGILGVLFGALLVYVGL